MIGRVLHRERPRLSWAHVDRLWQVFRMRHVTCVYRGGGRLCSVIMLSIFFTMLALRAIHLSNYENHKRISMLSERIYDRTECSHMHIAVSSNGYQQRQRLPILIKSMLMYNRDSILHLHILSTKHNKHSIEVLMNTWNLPQVVPHFYIDDGFVEDFTSLVELTGYFTRNRPVLKGVDQLILVQPEVCFVEDVAILWDQFPALVNDKMMVAIESSVTSPAQWMYSGVILLNLNQIDPILDTLKPSCDNASLAVNMDSMTTRDARALISVMCRGSSGNWKVAIDRKLYEIPTIQDASLPPLYVGNISLSHPLYERITQAENIDGDVFRLTQPLCVKAEHQITYVGDPCEMFPIIATIKRRTQLYYAGNRIPSSSSMTPEVTLVTQLMLNRIRNLERLLTAWKGPSHVTLYMTDEEAVKFSDIYRASPVLSSVNASYHVIYKRHTYYPINYARNVAIREVTTPYYVMVDVDFAAQPSLFDNIQSHLKKLRPHEKKAFVIPVFETLFAEYEIPSTKSQLVEDLNRKQLLPYHQIEGVWTRGHRMTNYEKWRESSQTYQVPWEFGYEPYVVVPTAEFMYDETLVERMRDKLTYTIEVFLKGYTLHVLPFDYLIHTPHEKSKSYTLSDNAFQACAGVLYQRSINNMKHTYSQRASSTLLQMFQQ